MTDCILWEKSVMPSGYGKAWFRGKTTTAHRMAYIMAKGEIPEGYHVDHLCGVKLCVNPDHLEAVTAIENCRRSGAKLTADDIRDIRQMAEADYTDQQIADAMNVNRRQISKIVSGQQWADLPLADLPERERKHGPRTRVAVE